MPEHRILSPILAAWRRLTALPAYSLLVAGDEQIAAEDPRRFSRGWAGLMILSLGWGLALAGLWGISWRLFKEPSSILFTPAAAAVSFLLLWPFRRGAIALAEIVAGPDAAGRALALALLVGVFMMCMLGLNTNHYHSEAQWPGFLAWARPPAELYRVLILMPLWGGWAMLIVGQFCRPGEGAEPAVAAFVRGCSPVVAVGCMIPPALLTWGYFQFLGGRETILSGVTVVAAIAGGLALCHRTGGLKRRALLAVNVLTQLAFVLTYLANR